MRRGVDTIRYFLLLVVLFAATGLLAGEAVREPGVGNPATSLPDLGGSVMRMLGALVLVIALFLGGVWFFRNAQRFGLRRAPAPRLSVLEVKSLGNRHALFVVGYEQQRMLLASSPNGVNLICHLPESDAAEAVVAPAATVSFADALQQMVARKA